MSIRIFNTLGRKKEIFEPIEDKKVRMYVCGPTVYNKAHIGHAMSSMVFDIIRRYLEFRGYDVIHTMNFTDVDDKIIQRANELNVDPFDLANGYISDYEEHLQELNIQLPKIKPRATNEIQEIINMVQSLIDKGFAYPMDGDVYFRVEKFNGYGKLSGRKLEDMKTGTRINVDDRKETPMDFALWKSAKPGEPAWDSPWGKGRPGWHIECSAMNLHHLGEEIDIHGGGNDLIFPHHENEIAQTEALTGKPFARYWIHNGMLQLSGEKMSKSLGNMITIEEFLEDHSGDVLRIMVLNSGYRNPLTFNNEVIGQAEKALERITSAFKTAGQNAKGLSKEELENLEKEMETTRNGFISSMDDDFNSAGALGYLFGLVKAINSARDKGASAEELEKAQNSLKELTDVFGLTLKKEEKDSNADAFIALLLEVRQEIRKQKLYEMSDLIRDRLLELGVRIEDSKDGSTWSWN